MRTSGSDGCLPTDRPLGQDNWTITSGPRTPQALLTCIPTCGCVSSEPGCMIRLRRAPWRLGLRRGVSVGHRQPWVAWLLSQRFGAGCVPGRLFELLLFGSGRRQVIKEVELMAIAKVSFALGLCKLLRWRVTCQGGRRKVAFRRRADGCLSLVTARQARVRPHGRRDWSAWV